MKKGFTTLINNNPKYQALHSVLIDSLIEFTPFDIEVFSVGFDYTHPNKRVLSSRIEVQDKNSFHHICYAKMLAASLSSFDISCFVDSDSIAHPNINHIFDKISDSEKFVIGPKHPLDPNNQKNIMEFLGVQRKSQPYIHAATFLFTKNSSSFLREVYDICHKCNNSGVSPANQDETVLNSMLWKNNLEANYIKWYDPSPEFFSQYYG